MVWATVAALLVAVVAFRGTFASIVEKWYDDAAFSHGFLIIPISLWLAWRQREALSHVEMRPTWLGVAAVLACAAAWIVAAASGVLVVEQFAVVLLVPALVLTVLGGQAVRTLVFPLGFLLFAVPFGRALVPALMQATADIATYALQWSGVPIYRSHMYISIPAGSFEVARACSGLNYFVTGLVLGVLYAHLTYRGWKKRALCVLAFILVPILANGLRVYFTILMSHLTDMRFGPGTEHVTFGRIFFIVVMIVMFWVGRRWHDESPAEPASAEGLMTPRQPMALGAWAPVPMALAIVVLAPPYLGASMARAAAGLDGAAAAIRLPVGRDGWQGPIEDGTGWKPAYSGSLAERQGIYLGSGGQVDVFVAAYGLGKSGGEEMVSAGNVLFPDEFESLAVIEVRPVALPSGGELAVREVTLRVDGDSRLVWHWYFVGDRSATNEFVVKALEAARLATGGAGLERIVTLSTPLDHDARSRLQSFVVAHPECVASGFATQACGG